MVERVLITGASSDLGMAVARSILTSDPASTLIAHCHGGEGRIASLTEEFGDRVTGVVADLSNRAGIDAFIEDAVRIGVPTQVIHLPALRLRYERLSKFDLDRFHSDLAIQLESAILLLKVFGPPMSKLERARMVFVLSSVTKGLPPKFMSMYTIIKYAQLGLMRAAAAEYVATGFCINAVSPSMIETQFVEEIGDVAVRMSAESHPKGRNATTADIVGAIRFLLSPAADFLTGIDIPVTGGTHC